ncbi:MAG: prepilin-type N-terminal cleavage/methylation domain-containing protein [Treponema sp.]|nr:prepilin-type N-terminal cleavage/methylation domain-containing protein [Treponema sp.]
MKDSNAGFSLMETLVTIAIILVVSFSVLIAFRSGTLGTLNALNEINTARTIIRTDRFIREQAESIHIPYWLNSFDSIENLKNELWRSRAGTLIKEISLITDSSGFIRGVNVSFVVDNKTYSTRTLFSSIPVSGNIK